MQNSQNFSQFPELYNSRKLKIYRFHYLFYLLLLYQKALLRFSIFFSHRPFIIVIQKKKKKQKDHLSFCWLFKFFHLSILLITASLL